MISKDIVEHILDDLGSPETKHQLQHDTKLFNIYEGDLLTYVDKLLQSSLSSQAYYNIKDRISPINILKRVIDKLSAIYTPGPVRRLVPADNLANAELFEFYEQNMQINQKGIQANEFFNMYKSCLWYPYVADGIPRLQIIPNHKFKVYGLDRNKPLDPTHVVLFMGWYKNKKNEDKQIYYVWSDDNFVIVDEDGLIMQDKMAEFNNAEGINPFGKLPFVYTNRSQNLITPKPDSDTLCMTTLVPVLFSDLNYASKFSAFSLLYGIDLDMDNIKFSPDTILNLKSDPEAEKQPSLDLIKPQADITNTIELIMTQVDLWLRTRNIKPGTIGKANANASGIAKILDEMDVYEERLKQIDFFEDAEAKLWDLISNYLHPYWARTGQVQDTRAFTPDFKVDTIFSQPVRRMDPLEQLDVIDKRLSLGLITKRMALQELYPTKTDEEIEQHLEQLQQESDTNNVIRIENNGLQEQEQEQEQQENQT